MLNAIPDINAKDQWAVIIRYVNNHNVHKWLIWSIHCTDTTGQIYVNNMNQKILLSDTSKSPLPVTTLFTLLNS